MTTEEIWTHENMIKFVFYGKEMKFDSEQNHHKDLDCFKFICEVIEGASCLNSNRFTKSMKKAMGEKKELHKSFLKFFSIPDCKFEHEETPMIDIYTKALKAFEKEGNPKKDKLDFMAELKSRIKEADVRIKKEDNENSLKDFFDFSWQTSHLVKTFFVPFMLSIKEAEVEVKNSSGETEMVEKLYFWPISGPAFNHRKIDVYQHFYQQGKGTKKKIMNHILSENAHDSLNCQQSCLVMYSIANNQSGKIKKKKCSPCTCMIEQSNNINLQDSFQHAVAKEITIDDMKSFCKGVMVSFVSIFQQAARKVKKPPSYRVIYVINF